MKEPIFKVIISFNVGESSTCLCNMTEPHDAQEFFDRLKQGYLHWRRPLSDAMHSLSILVPISRRDDAYRDLIRDVCERWNTDPEIAGLGPSHIELCLTNRGDNWVGCTTASDLIRKMSSEQGALRFVDYLQWMRDIEAQMRKAKQDEKSRRRLNPVLHPVELPKAIKSEIASYLRLEYGESVRDKNSVKARDLVLEGEFVIDGIPTQYWRYPSSNPKRPCWATVERFDDLYCLGVTDKKPPKE